MRISRAEYWGMTLPEYWSLFDAHFGNFKAPMTMSKYEEMKAAEKAREEKRAQKAQGGAKLNG